MGVRAALRVVPSLPTRPTNEEALCEAIEESGIRRSPAGFYVGGLVGTYVLDALIGRGGMAEVWRGHSVRTGESVAIKRILPRLAQNTLCLAMFLDEARMGMRLGHPNVVRGIEIGDCASEPFLVSELVEGPSCAMLLRAALAREERVPASAALHVVTRLLEALDYVHQLPDEHGKPLGVVHRDVSPGNVLLATSGVVKLADFGIVHMTDSVPRALPGTLQGKRGYMAPEQLAGTRIDARTDLFAAGIVLSELLTGEPLFYQSSELEFLLENYRAETGKLERVPRHLRRTLLRALMRCPSERHESAREMIDDLTRAAALDGIEASASELDSVLERLGMVGPGSEVDREPRPARRGRRSDSSLRASLPERPPPSVASSPRWTSTRSTLIANAMHSIATGKRPLELPALADAALLRHYAELPAYRFGETPRAAWRSTFSRASLPSLLFALLEERPTGLCVFRRPGHEKRIYLDHGLPVFAASSDPEELLGNRLVRAGHVSREQVEHAVEHAIRNGGRLGDALVDIARVRPVVVLRELMAQVTDRFTEVGFWSDGELVFCPGERPGIASVRPHEAPEALVVRLIRRGYTEAELASLLGPIAVEPLAQLRDTHRVAQLDLTPLEATVLERWGFRERLALIQLRLSSRVSRVDVLRAVFIGLASGVIRPIREHVAA